MVHAACTRRGSVLCSRPPWSTERPPPSDVVADSAEPPISLEPPSCSRVSPKRRQTYPELDHCRRCRLVVFGLEVGGRWAEEAATFIRLLARARAASAPAAVRNSAQAAWVLCWSGLISVAAQRTLAATFFFSRTFFRLPRVPEFRTLGLQTASYR